MTQFDYYMRKTYLKTASLLEKCCSCAAILGEADRATINIAKAYGAHLGYAFQVRLSFFFSLFSSPAGSMCAVMRVRWCVRLCDADSHHDGCARSWWTTCWTLPERHRIWASPQQSISRSAWPPLLVPPASRTLSHSLARSRARSPCVRACAVLFAMEEFGELRALVERGFKEEGDVEKAFSLVQRSQGIARTHALAQYAPWPSLLSRTRSVIVVLWSDVARASTTQQPQRREHCAKAVETIGQLAPSPYRDALARLTEKVLSRSS